MAGMQPSSYEASCRMARVRQRGTRAELDLRKALHGRGLRYRIQVPLLAKPPRVADIVFPKIFLAIFVDGCFWHSCSAHASWPKSNAAFWRGKIETNRACDADINMRLKALGWKVVRVWAHETATVAADRIAGCVEARKHAGVGK
jgi:DNA mismatch endonuclease (patch repair protein)